MLRTNHLMRLYFSRNNCNFPKMKTPNGTFGCDFLIKSDNVKIEDLSEKGFSVEY